ncbi:tetratricopeptide repeat protein [Oscillatoriales cyanobacterium LEGE 11467]|uniref:Tetratricopeptide repeat protein n=1 Tax=Zarconia navalis LEGE 11467 TaxID=1828826 RepID=A0A928VUP7_9CYAN|nr:tetratricopeptide repeat protein [Zarconia navalis]MBE9039648.1 tetratricopeptide repeat protein [Zarconia navalis LEGE 11467]
MKHPLFFLSKFIRIPHIPLSLYLLLGCVAMPSASGKSIPQPPNAIAQTEDIEDIFANPLQLTEPDPLLPDPDRELSDAERQTLDRALDELNTQAEAEFAAGNVLEAFELWNRELRLRRYTDSVSEIEALGEVGGNALDEGNFVQLQLVSARLRQIQEEQLEPDECEDDEERATVDLEVLQALGVAYDRTGAPERAVPLLQQVLTESRRRQDKSEEEEALQNLARISLDALDYPAAAQSYEDLLAIAKFRKDTDDEATYLQQLAFTYRKMQQLLLPLDRQREVTQRSIEVRQQLVVLIERQTITPATQAEIVDLRLEIAADYVHLSHLDREIAAALQTENQQELAERSLESADTNIRFAEQVYRETYIFSWTLQQFYRASTALTELAALYESLDRFSEALQVYQTQIDVLQLARDRYGMTIAYDRMGELFQLTGAYPQALQAYLKALEIAQQLGDRQDYFALKIERIRQQSPR